MRHFMADTLEWFARRLRGKAVPGGLLGGQWTGTGFTDSYKRNRSPTPNELLAELKATAWTCASLNAQMCATSPPKLYVTTKHNQPVAKCATAKLRRKREEWLRKATDLDDSADVQQVTDHPILDLFRQVNAVHNAFDLWELTTLYQEVHGSSYWYLERDKALGTPSEIWVLPAQNVYPKRDKDSKNLVDYYEYRSGQTMQKFDPEDIIHFRYPDPRDPYTAGLSPLRACFEQVALSSQYAAFKQAKFENHAVPDAILSPDEMIGEEERARLEVEWNQRLRRGGAGRVIVAESAMKMQTLNFSMGDMAALAEMGATKEMIMNAFHVPVAFFSTHTNLANLQASDNQHADQCIKPRLTRRDEKLNQVFVPLFDPSGRLFLKADDPTPGDPRTVMLQRRFDMGQGVRTINEVRGDDGLPPVEWGYLPWLARGLFQPGAAPTEPEPAQAVPFGQ